MHKFYNIIVDVSKAVFQLLFFFVLYILFSFICCYMVSFRVSVTLSLYSVIVTFSEYPHIYIS